MSLCSDVAGSKAMILRDGDLMHYIYAENLGNSNVIGMCLVFNKAYIRHVSKIFGFLRGLIESTLLKQGKIIRYNNQGDIEFVTTNISDDTRTFDYVKALVNSKLDSENNYFGVSELTTTYNGLHNSEIVDGNTANSEILRLQQRYNQIIIDYKKGIEEDLTRKVIFELQLQISVLNKKIDSQNQIISNLEKAKKQYRKVLLLCGVLLCCCAGLYFLYSTLDKTERNLQYTSEQLGSATDSISSLNTTLTQKQDTICSLNNEVRAERRQKEAAQSILNNIQSKCPFIITGTECNLSSGQYTIKYFAKESGSHSFRIKAIDEDSGLEYTAKTVSEYVYSGTGSFTVHFSRSFNPSDWYTFEIWDGNRIIGGSRH